MTNDYFGENVDSNIFHQWQAGKIVQFNQQNILLVSEKISNDKNCKFRQAALRIFNHLLANMNSEGKVAINARQLSKTMDIHYDTVTKCLKYLREIEVIKIEK